MSEWITIKAGDPGAFKAYVARPGLSPAPVIVVVQEIFGVNPPLRQICDDFAARGLVAIAPDLFWRVKPGIELDAANEAERQQAFAIMKDFNQDLAIEDIRATVAAGREITGGNGKVGVVGYCLGGRLGYLCATRKVGDACIGYYGVGIDKYLPEAQGLDRPLLLHIAGSDPYVDRDAREAVHQGLDPLPLATLYDYPDADHAFARPGSSHYHAQAAVSANARSVAFFNQYLK